MRSRGDQFRQRARQAVEDETLLPEALEELSTALEELRVTEKEVRGPERAAGRGPPVGGGVLMERHGLDDQAAITRLRRQARSSSRKLTDVAREIIKDAANSQTV